MITYTNPQQITTASNVPANYVDPTNPYNPWGYSYPWYTWPPTPLTYPLSFYTETTDTTAPTSQPGPLSFEPSDDDMAEQPDAPEEDHSTDLASMIRQIVRDELSKVRHAEKSTKGIARDVLKLIKDELRTARGGR